ncbi:S-layer homology domain-containing protein [Brevibacillus choshinensis]|uniref:S-layer homology domain-containing protein n=1 Tax=Brevibacillus choshinensis TaxID=54911 RepID=A0ABX7FQS0_BRECH|nr:S-layer homology domain-containing protein [Brevibacillus choshinensis]QRG67977.1 S-layer homology domain-containing protein [Brevibacillus choshinensis]
MNVRRTVLVLSTFGFLALSTNLHAFAATAPFTDVSQVASKEIITSLQQRGYLHGVTDQQFQPEATITAAQGIQLIVNALDLNIDGIRFIQEPKATNYFAKADNDAWYAPALIIAANNGLKLPADLDPDKEWSREEFIYQLVSAVEQHVNLPMINIVPVEINDGDALDPSYQGAIQRALAFGVAKLDAEGNMHPKDVISRSEAAELIYGAIEYLKAHPAPAADAMQP